MLDRVARTRGSTVRHGARVVAQEKQPEAGLHVSMQTFLLLVWPGKQARHGREYGWGGWLR